MSQPTQPRASLSLFPNPSISNPQPPVVRNQTPMGRRSESRERRAATPQQYHQPQVYQAPRATSPQASPPRQTGRQTPQQQPVTMTFAPPPSHALNAHPVEESQQYQQPPPQQEQQWPLQQQLQPQFDFVVQQPTPVTEIPGRSESAFSEASPYYQGNGVRNSMAKPPISDSPSSQQPLQSIFPTYNPEVALEHQQYVPTQMSPTHIPRNIISRQGNYPINEDGVSEDYDNDERAHTVRSPDRSAEPARVWPRQPQQPPVIPTICSTEQLKSLWRVANGWRASPSEGRVYCLKLTQEKDAPVYNLGSQTQAFWNMRIDPTSLSARVTLSRHDPSKTIKKPDSPSGSVFRGSGGGSGSSKRRSLGQNWQEALTVTLEEESRKHQPNDGLVALLMPTPAMKMAEERAEAPAAIEMAENESARLVWDDDTSTYFFVHQALQKPFFIHVERSPAWSRVEYTLEHTESPQHLAKLTRDGAGGGWLELDTGLASKIDSFFILDVAVSALLLVASFDERNSSNVAIESFEAPPALQEPKPVKKDSKSLKKGRKKVEEFEIDIESQDDSVGKPMPKVKERKTEDRLPFPLRVIVKLTKGIFKICIFFLTAIAKVFGLMFRCCYKCVGSKY
ncbi:hypothetical protein CC79DRAFT_1328769 [Sarocladium strictum]